MKKLILLVLVIFLHDTLLEAQKLPPKEKLLPEEYDPDEFPQWMQSVRRFEVVSLGTYPITFFLTSLTYDFVKFSSNNFDPAYSLGSQRRNGDIEIIALSALGFSLLLGLVDMIINISKRNKLENDSEKAQTVPRPVEQQ